MGVEYAGNPPAVLPRQVEIDRWIQRCVDHHRCPIRTNQIRETALPRATNLDDLRGAAGHGHIRRVPGQTPRLHPAQQRARWYAARLELLSRDQADLAGPADRD